MLTSQYCIVSVFIRKGFIMSIVIFQNKKKNGLRTMQNEWRFYANIHFTMLCQRKYLLFLLLLV